MKFFTPLKSPKEIVEFIQSALKSSDLPAKVSASLEGDDHIKVTISKFGTSSLHFSVQPSGDGSECALVSQDIASLHKPFIGDVEAWVVEHVVVASGGKVLA